MHDSVTAKPFSSSRFFISPASRWALPVWEPKRMVTSRSIAAAAGVPAAGSRNGRRRATGVPAPARTAQAGQVAAEPDHLIGRERSQQLVQGFRLLLVERAVVDSEGKSTHQFGPGNQYTCRRTGFQPVAFDLPRISHQPERLYPKHARHGCAEFRHLRPGTSIIIKSIDSVIILLIGSSVKFEISNSLANTSRRP